MTVWSKKNKQGMSPKSKEQFASIRERSTATIKDTALRLFARNGFHNTSISLIAKEAGISKGLLYNYFESKEALLEGIIGDVIDVTDQFLASVSGQDMTPFDRLKHIVTSSVDMVKANPGYWKLLTSLGFQTEALEKLEPILKAKQVQVIAYLEALFQEMGAACPKEEAYLFGAQMDGMMLHYLTVQDAYPLDSMQDFLIKKLENIGGHHITN
jgi:AcrR family transcriptional regulator